MNFRIFDPIRIIYEKTYIHYCRRWICQYRGRNSFDHFSSLFCVEDRHLHTSSLIEQDMQGAQGLLGQEIFPTCNANSSSGSRLCFSVSYRSRREPDHQFRFYIWLICLREWRDVSTFAPLELSPRMVSLLTWAPDMLAEGAIGIKQSTFELEETSQHRKIPRGTSCVDSFL